MRRSDHLSPCSTVITVGYGDRFPVTAPGRAIGAGAMILGISLFGLLAALVGVVARRKGLGEEIDPQMAEINERWSGWSGSWKGSSRAMKAPTRINPV